uniref:Uncharacterized protein n=1 Tax=Cannabis sativa TaxID=3483 RepID=A0A803QE00_CANSA
MTLKRMYNKITHKKRGMSKEMINMRSKGKKTEVEYNSWGQAVSDGTDKLRSEIGKYVRHHVILLVDD